MSAWLWRSSSAAKWRRGVVYQTDAAVTQKARIAGVFPADSYTPVSYPIAALSRNDTPAARDFVRFLDSTEAREVYKRFGFSVR